MLVRADGWDVGAPVLVGIELLMRAGGWTSAFLCWAVYGLLVKADGWDVGVPMLAVYNILTC